MISVGGERETDDGIMFFDCKKNENSELKPHHFRSSNVKAELTYLKVCWENCVTETIYIPAITILIEESDEEIYTRKLHTILFFEDPIMEDSVVSSSSSLAVPERVILEKTHNFPPYKQRKQNKHDSDILVANGKIDNAGILMRNLSESNKKNEESVETSEIYAMKCLYNKILVPKKIENGFRSKTATYIYHVLPMEKEIILEYDTYRMNVKAFPKDRQIFNDFQQISAQVEIKLLIENDKLKKDIKKLELKQTVEKSSLNPIPCNESEKKHYNETISKLKVIRALRNEINF